MSLLSALFSSVLSVSGCSDHDVKVKKILNQPVANSLNLTH